MLTKLKKTADRNGATSTAGDIAKKGGKGRCAVYAEREGDGFALQFRDYGNYGKERWHAALPTTAEELGEMINALQALLVGDCDTTELPGAELEALLAPPPPEDEPQETAEAEAAEETESAEEPAPDPAALEAEPVDDIEQLTA